jgi:3-dehydroquinate synthetase
VVKYGVIGDARLFAYLEKSVKSVLHRERSTLDFVIPRCIRAKANVVGRDERESGLREILNFGHTFAHAFETATRYQRYLHGEAVGWGMIAAARLSAKLGMLQTDEVKRIEQLVRSIGPLPPLPKAPPERLIEIMRSDKKTRAGKLRFVLTGGLGKAETVAGVPVSAVRRILLDLGSDA